MKILITGGNGYIGKALIKSLREHHELVCPSRNSVDFTDAKQAKLFFNQCCGEGGPFDYVIHCAVQGGNRLKIDDESVLLNNLKMYYNLVDNRKFFGRFISFGSGAEILYPETPYGFSKKIIADSMSEKEGFYNIRIYGLFDENELPTRFIKANILRYINNQPMEIHSDKAMDFFYMEDLKSLVDYYLSHKDLPKTIACVYPYTYRLSRIANVINQLDHHKVEVMTSQKNEPNYDVFGDDSCEFACDIIKCIGLEEGIKETYKNLKHKNS